MGHPDSWCWKKPKPAFVSRANVVVDAIVPSSKGKEAGGVVYMVLLGEDVVSQTSEIVAATERMATDEPVIETKDLL